MRTAKRVVFLVLPFIVSCSSGGNRQRRPYLVDENLANAARHLNAGREQEAAQLYHAVVFADPTNAEARARLESLGVTGRFLTEPTALGQNLVQEPLRDSLGLRIATYPLNRVLDVLDLVTVQVGPQGGIYADVHVTHALRLAAGGGGGVELGWSQKRELALGTGHRTGWALGPFALEGAGAARLGTHGARNTKFAAFGMNRPSDFSYQRYRDYWSIGGQAIVGAVGARLELHPVELVDLVAGILFADPLRDDIGTTRGLELTSADREAMDDLLRTLTPAERRARMRGRRIAPVPRPVLEAEKESAEDEAEEDAG
jgi:hypothetical protein